MAHPQSTPRGGKATQRLDIGAGNLQADSTGNIKFYDGIKLSNTKYIDANSTGIMITAETTLPTTDGGNYKIALVVTAAGTAGLAINTTGTTWKYCLMTSNINATAGD
jgi:hypothetical protein